MICYDEFQKITRKANKNSLAKRKPVFGVGENDSDYITKIVVRGKTIACPAYIKWKSMLLRAYSADCHSRQVTYFGVSVCEDWLTFSTFRNWLCKHDGFESLDLDKDILQAGNKIYSPEYCLLVTRSVNTLLLDGQKSRGKLMVGVSMNRGLFMSQCNNGNRQVTLGRFNTEEEAHEVYKYHKYHHIVNVANEQSCKKTKEGLLARAAIFKTEYKPDNKKW